MCSLISSHYVKIIDLHFETNGKVSDGAKGLNRGFRKWKSTFRFFSEHNLKCKKYRAGCRMQKWNLPHATPYFLKIFFSCFTLELNFNENLALDFSRWVYPIKAVPAKNYHGVDNVICANWVVVISSAPWKGTTLVLYHLKGGKQPLWSESVSIKLS